MSLALRLAACDLLYPLVGYALLRALALAGRGRGGLRLLGLAYLAGFALLETALALAAMAGLDPGVWTALALAAALVAACLLLRRRRDPLAACARPRLGGRAGDAAAALAAGAVVLAAAAALARALRGEWNPVADFDALWFWFPKAASIADAHGLAAAAWRSLPHPEYPPLVPVADELVFRFAGGVHPALVPFQQALLGAAFLGAAAALLDRLAARALALPALALIATAPWFAGNLASPLPDQTLAYLVSGAALAGVLWLAAPDPAWLWLGAVLLAAATLTKLEGLFFAALLALALLAAALLRHRRAGLAAAWLLLGPAAAIPWRLWLAANGIPASSPDYRLSRLLDSAYLGSNRARLSFALHRMYHVTESMFASVSPFGPAPSGLAAAARVAAACLFVGLAAFCATRLPQLTAPLAAWFLAALAGLAAVYWTGRIGIQEYVAVTVDRVEETIVLVPATVLPLLLSLALAAPPAGAAKPPPPGRPPSSPRPR